ncbi:DUF262 domain-containing protein [Methyloceanibacter sp.]|uniref:DUF262 domain-containing protein n=1 Tax=Methyloceanibacter sp. TaxID=1965321 RepID=UPI002D6CD064|nr:DUF262 domain-containing protein [Methyloceanibacter sp.]HZP10015.1 DUF262 domain-containing protein [Methyloceanibacter sp.]
MDAKDHPVISVLSDQKRFMVPIYQRQYSWSEKYWNDFWDDLVAKSEETLEGLPKFKHYMGALIIAPGADGYVVGTTPRVQVVDGQQRLTTFQLFLAALREVAIRMNCPDVADSVQNYIFNRPMTGDHDADAKFKLVPTPEDKKVFHDIMSGNWQSVQKKYASAFYKKGTLRVSTAPLTIKALAFFMEKIDDYSRFGVYDADEERPTEADDEATRRRRLQALLEALLNHLKLVVITLDENDDAQVIFETLNSKAEPLLAMDLVRNNIFHRAEAQGESSQELFETKWRPLQGRFWKSDSPRAKPRRPRIDHFLSHALTAQTGKEVSLRELYAEYRAFSRPKGKPRFTTVEEELDALLQFTPAYELLENGGSDSAITRLGTKLAVWEVATAYPLIFNIERANVDDAEKAALYRLIYSYLVRRAICGLTAKNLNKTFQRVVGVFLKEGVSRASFANAFAGQTGPAVRYPADEEFRTAIRSNPAYQLILKKERLTDILWELELKTRNKFSVGTPRPTGMSIEHIIPQRWSEHWTLSDGRKAPSDLVTGADEKMLSLIAQRQSVLHTLGNLTLITVPGNSAASNSAFPQKRQWLKKSLLALNLEITDEKNTDWNEHNVLTRADALYKLATSIWPAIDAETVSGL